MIYKISVFIIDTSVQSFLMADVEVQQMYLKISIAVRLTSNVFLHGG